MLHADPSFPDRDTTKSRKDEHMTTSPDPHARLVGGDVSEVALPGIGQRYDLRGIDGGPITIVIHHSGRRDLYVLGAGGEPQASVALTDDQARTLGAILGGAYFKPAVVAEIEAVIGGLLIDWVTLDDARPASAGPSPSSRSAAARG